MLYLKAHEYKPECYIPAPLPHSRLDKILKSEDYDIVKDMSSEKLAQLLDTAIYLQLKPLIELCAATAASTIRGILSIDARVDLETDREETKPSKHCCCPTARRRTREEVLQPGT